MDKAMTILRILRRLGVKAMDRVAAILPSAIVRTACAHDPGHQTECSGFTPLGGWQPSQYDAISQRERFELLQAPMLVLVMRVFRTLEPAAEDETATLPELHEGPNAAAGSTAGSRPTLSVEGETVVRHKLVVGDFGAGIPDSTCKLPPGRSKRRGF
jgi:hypothetical protein